jgi:hypothetical protein
MHKTEIEIRRIRLINYLAAACAVSNPPTRKNSIIIERERERERERESNTRLNGTIIMICSRKA